MVYDVVIIGAGATGLFAGINLDKGLSKLILEKTDKPGTKVLLSGGERANVSNIDIEVERDYFGQNKKALISIFKRYNQRDIQSFFAENGINIIEEDRGRLILESGDSKELVNLLLKKVKENNCDIRLNSEVEGIKKIKEIYEIQLLNGIKYKAKNLIVSTGGKSFFQVGTTGEGYKFAENFGINIYTPYRALCGLTTKKDFKELSGSSVNVGLKLLDNKISHPGISSLKSNGRRLQLIYKEKGALLFTHFGISGPIVFNTATVLGEYLNSININSENDKIKYILENIKIELNIKKEEATKKIYNFFKKEIDNDEKIEFGLQDWRSWKEAKATGGGIDMNELDKNMQSKKYDGLYFIGEVVDITGKTGGFNLQWAWSSAYVCGKSIK